MQLAPLKRNVVLFKGSFAALGSSDGDRISFKACKYVDIRIAMYSDEVLGYSFHIGFIIGINALKAFKLSAYHNGGELYFTQFFCYLVKYRDIPESLGGYNSAIKMKRLKQRVNDILIIQLLTFDLVIIYVGIHRNIGICGKGCLCYDAEYFVLFGIVGSCGNYSYSLSCHYITP